MEIIVFLILTAVGIGITAYWHARENDRINKLKEEGKPTDYDTELGALKALGKSFLSMLPMIIFGLLLIVKMCERSFK